MNDLTPDQIADNANGAQQFTTDGQISQAVPISDQIAAAKFAAANKQTVKRRPLRGIRFVQVVTSDD